MATAEAMIWGRNWPTFRVILPPIDSDAPSDIDMTLGLEELEGLDFNFDLLFANEYASIPTCAILDAAASKATVNMPSKKPEQRASIGLG
ncbi:hypothetical protein MVEN_01178500 [Mycena venus]|uniref:Uncharacterized protein n=1 Tax=Mycena venus TaxID=2733690 RepID=A0A8H7CYJ7_9AGAR|nr:hypothetical protein MVEN_01178500 [Mycena venus]